MKAPIIHRWACVSDAWDVAGQPGGVCGQPHAQVGFISLHGFRHQGVSPQGFNYRTPTDNRQNARYSNSPLLRVLCEEVAIRCIEALVMPVSICDGVQGVQGVNIPH